MPQHGGGAGKLPFGAGLPLPVLGDEVAAAAVVKKDGMLEKEIFYFLLPAVTRRFHPRHPPGLGNPRKDGRFFT
jgi:hypothetical protein